MDVEAVPKFKNIIFNESFSLIFQVYKVFRTVTLHLYQPITVRRYTFKISYRMELNESDFL